MNDTAQSTQNTKSQDQQSSVTSPSQPLPQQSVPAGGKETAPVVVATKPEPLMQEHLPQVEMPQEVKEAGVEEVKGEILEVSPDMQQAGVQPVGLAAAIPTKPALKFPMTEEKAQGILKMHKKVKESVTWLAMLVVRQMKILRLKQKEEK